MIKQPTDKSHFLLPDLGEGVHEAELIRWRVKPGEHVEEHQTMAEMETDKALVEVPSPWTGVIKDLKYREGDIVDVGTVLVTYAVDGAAQPKSDSDPAKREDAGTVVGSVDNELRVSNAFARRQPEVEATVVAGKVLATPAVRRLARENDIDIDTIPGTGRGGRVTAADVDARLGGAAPAVRGTSPVTTGPRAPRAPLVPAGAEQRIPFRGVRRKIAEALEHSVKTAVHFTVVDEADVTALEVTQREHSNVFSRKLSLLPFVMVAVTKALREHPELNCNVDDASSEIVLLGDINLGCAVDTDHGLMVPNIRNADGLGLIELADEVSRLAAGCRDRTIDREELTGGTFTISNVGSYGGMFATPIINYPEVGILAVGRARERVLTRDGMFYAGRVLPLSLSCDHRVVDGAIGARFLNTVVKLLENADTLVA